MAITPNMGLDLPTVSVTLGPEWASDNNTAFTTIDSHDHTTGNGVKITPSGLNINTDLPMNEHALTEVANVQLVDQVTPIATVAAVNQVGGDLYWNNGSGTPVQITSGGSVIAASDGISRRFESFSVVANKVISPADTLSYLTVNTASAYQITLPSAAGVPAGRFYEVVDGAGLAGTNNITVAPDGADTINTVAGNVVLNYNDIRARFVADGVSNWVMTIVQGTLQVQTAQYADSSVTTAKILNGNVTETKIATDAVTTLKVADANITRAKLSSMGQQVSASCGTFSTTSAVAVDVPNLTCTITSTGRPIKIMMMADSSGSGGAGISAEGTNGISEVFFSILRGATLLAEYPVAITVNGGLDVRNSQPCSAIAFEDVVAAGTYTYKIQVRTIAAGAGTKTARCNFAKLFVYEHF